MQKLSLETHGRYQKRSSAKLLQISCPTWNLICASSECWQSGQAGWLQYWLCHQQHFCQNVDLCLVQDPDLSFLCFTRSLLSCWQQILEHNPALVTCVYHLEMSWRKQYCLNKTVEFVLSFRCLFYKPDDLQTRYLKQFVFPCIWIISYLATCIIL